ncbi:MAG: hypothetical protein M1817_005364 [Caeruleum heppii]|nr:MAG: hypothetical protein M1817_005364 [Caeruleum heppii]
MKRVKEEFPLLAGQGLYAADIRGDGNCLFNALSDQIYGTQNQHREIRARVIDYMRDNASYYKQFVEVHSGGGTRRNPKRKSAGTFASTNSAVAPTAAEVDKVFEAHLQQMARGGTYGDNMEITAFSAAYGVDVMIYQRDLAYLVRGGELRGHQTAHIAYHIWEHYSSIRNLDGPHDGLPNVQSTESTATEYTAKAEAAHNPPFVAPWMIKAVTNSLPYLADPALIQRTLEEHGGSIDNAVSKLLDREESASVSSSQSQATSSSVERDPDSEDEAQMSGPIKKRDRRLSRETKEMMRQRGIRKAIARNKVKAMAALRESEVVNIDLDVAVAETKWSDANSSDPPTDFDQLLGKPRAKPYSVRDLAMRREMIRRVKAESSYSSDTSADDTWRPSSAEGDSTASEYSDSSSFVVSNTAIRGRSTFSPSPSPALPTISTHPPSPPPNLTHAPKLSPHPPSHPCPAQQHPSTKVPIPSNSSKPHTSLKPPKRITARERKEQKKLAQKQAAKLRKQQATGADPVKVPYHHPQPGGAGGGKAIPLRTYENPPAVEQRLNGIRTLCI